MKKFNVGDLVRASRTGTTTTIEGVVTDVGDIGFSIDGVSSRLGLGRWDVEVLQRRLDEAALIAARRVANSALVGSTCLDDDDVAAIIRAYLKVASDE